MAPILGAARLLALINGALLAVGRQVSVVLIGLMVFAILLQVFFRYVLNNALPWPDEAARFMMLWMTGLVAPTAYRRGGFVAIDMLVLMLPRVVASLLNMFLLIIALLVLVTAVKIGWGEVTGFGGRFKTAALWLPTNVSFTEWFRVPRSWMMASLLVGVTLMTSVTVEMILRQIAVMMGREDDLPIIPEAATLGAD
ncbi:TRAP transporter small permease subunit [uncultured Litoreibacter sp.]|uniref:TRAP transporter small permease n=1 Tax=uncultured Litoreibacter sp. TaxID=1392394 RepID=UPI002630FC9F|nr:TRAP transporter small permease subunit [uncultured Litoreibacter sp.]